MELHSPSENKSELIFARALRAILASGGGAIVNNASFAGSAGLPGAGIYSASKHAVIGSTRSAALEFAQKGVRINAVSPGTIETPMIDRIVGNEKEGNPKRDALISLHPVGRLGKPEEVVSAVILLLENPFITGSVLPVDGGRLAR